MAEFTTIRYEVDDRIATVTLAWPDRLNAFNPEMAREVVAAFTRADEDDDVVPGEASAPVPGAPVHRLPGGDPGVAATAREPVAAAACRRVCVAGTYQSVRNWFWTRRHRRL